MRAILTSSLLATTLGFSGKSFSAVASEDGGTDMCSMACNQTLGCDQSYCKNNGLCFGLYHKGNAYCYQPGGADGCDDTSLEPVKCTEYPLTTCQDVCDRLVGCKDSAWGSYCKSWQDPPVCFGILKMYDGSLCYQSDPNCVGEPFECHFTVGPVQPTIAPSKPSTMPLPEYNTTTPQTMPGFGGQGQPTTAPGTTFSTVEVEPTVGPAVVTKTGVPIWTMEVPTNMTNTTAAPGGGFFSWFGF
ncbi:hypothetical protein Pmar_PMAR011852 [Perkinsus marinus ATCC 50983]|uniref:Uncharacterized protein n=1 Tax=Perkinsus marinus (strain ATCC 50983 / TXsc) TaxID=423536 RepID=C5LBI2_PERM5|nr:hypothetical protein Pmar_PMAR011852 [Perkinsus marinus ATCC 50983]EER05803.1 hypothetical protein Pmar_PMAR011852 [Perkinsus marinus ATCC 50983]|eukprot:XP_002773987.1 hypothetical protein Pmar_PMAR011852 [Perkinsus marinus ATCC 50983]